MKQLTLILALVLVTLAGPAFAETKTCVAANVSVTAPEGWAFTSTNDVLTITGPEAGMKFVIHVVPGEGKDGVVGAGTSVGQTLNGVEFQPPAQETLNEMPCWAMVGKAAAGTLEVVLNLVKVPNGSNLLIQYVAPMSLSERYDELVKSVFKSIKPVS